LIVLWMTRSLTDDIPGWGSLFHGEVGDGTVTVSAPRIEQILICFLRDDLSHDLTGQQLGSQCRS
jgi:hypothetical protein